MKIFVKTLKGDRFEIQVDLEDSVADVKKNVETVLGVTAAEQILIHKGKVLKDETTLEANKVSEKSIIGVVKRKLATNGTSSLNPQAHASTPASLAAEFEFMYIIGRSPSPNSDCPNLAKLSSYMRRSATTATECLSESCSQQTLRTAGSGALSRDAVANAFCSPYDDIDKVLDYLYSVSSSSSEHSEGQTHEEPETRPSAADLERALDFARYTEEFEYLRDMAQSNPSNAKDFVEILEKDNSPYFHFIRDNKADFLRLLREGKTGGNEMEQPHELQAVQTNEPNNGRDGGNLVGESKETEVDQTQADQTNKPNNGGGDGGNLVGESKETEVEVVATPEDNELIEMLEALGFERGDAEVAYFACNKNVNDAANHLLGYKHEPQE